MLEFSKELIVFYKIQKFVCDVLVAASDISGFCDDYLLAFFIYHQSLRRMCEADEQRKLMQKALRELVEVQNYMKSKRKILPFIVQDQITVVNQKTEELAEALQRFRACYIPLSHSIENLVKLFPRSKKCSGRCIKYLRTFWKHFRDCVTWCSCFPTKTET